MFGTTRPWWFAFHQVPKARARVLLHWEENSGHELGYDEISAAKGWLANLPIK